MILDFNKMKEKQLEHFYGGEKEVRARMHIDERNKIMLGKLEPGASIGLHTHTTSSEIIYVLQGQGKVLYEGEYETAESGSCHYCPKGSSHSLINDSAEDLVFFAVVPEQ